MFNVEFEEVTNQFCAEFDTVVHTGDGNLQSKSVSYTPTETAQSEMVTASPGYDGLSSVEVSVGAISSTYVGSGVTRKSAASYTPSENTQTIAANQYLDGAQTIDPIPSQYIVPSGAKSITANGQGIDVASYATANVNVPNSYSAGDEGKVVSNGALVSQTAHADVTPTTSDQTIDTTLNNTLKVKGDADLVAGNIKKDVEIFGVTGSYEGGGGGLTFEPLDYPVIIKNGRSSGTISCKPITYDDTVQFVANSLNITAGSTITINNFLTDGEYIWFSLNNVSQVSYNNQSYTDFVKSGSNWKIKIPSGFDGTIPFVFSP